ncbi:embryonal Fyn-associated substrate isoform X2 [Ascaphus truei]|uniref:embryonal Fyn-associated substrate isoform X2 n=1 Tax=Ascaphus truei TaxID=8439 RepID=UPI003F59B105
MMMVYEVPPAARLCLSSPHTSAPDDIYNSPRLVGASVQRPPEVYNMPAPLLRDPVSVLDMYDSPVSRVRAVALVAPQPVVPHPEEIPEDIYDVPPACHSLPPEEEEDEGSEGVYSMPSNLKRVSGLQNLYEAPEDILSTGHPPETPEPPRTHRLSVSSAGSARSGDSGGSRESSFLPHAVWEPRVDGTCTAHALSMLQQALAESHEEPRPAQVEKLQDFLGLAQVVLLYSCQASDPSLHGALSGHMEQLEHALRGLLEEQGPSEPLTQLVQEQSGSMVRLVSANAGLLFPRPRLSSSESLSRRPLPALPNASPVPQRKGSIQDRPLPPPPTLPHMPSDTGSGESAQSEYERIQSRDNHYVHLQGAVTSQKSLTKPKDRQTETSQGPTTDERETRNGVPLQIETPACPDPTEEDCQLLRFYAAQSRGHLQTLLSCVDTFLDSAGSQAPRIFVGHGKQLVIAAHKLVFIGDTLGRILSCAQLQAWLAGEGGALCQALKEVVLATKEAAALYPSPTALKDMAGSVSALCTHANSFTNLLQSLAS